MTDQGRKTIFLRLLLERYLANTVLVKADCIRQCQFRLRSTIARALIQGIMARSLAPTSSIGCAAILARMALNEVWLTRFSSIQSLTNLPDWMSSRMRFISARVASLTTR